MIFEQIQQIPKLQNMILENLYPIFFEKKMLSIGINVQLGPKNKLQNLGFHTYFNQSARQVVKMATKIFAVYCTA